MAQFYTLLTQVGQAKLANAIALGETIVITHIAVGDGGGSLPTPDSDRTSLVNEQRRAQINRVEVDEDNPNWIVVEQVLPPDVGGWTIREIGIYDEDEDLIGYGNYPETYKPTLDEGSGRTQTVRFVLQVSDTAAVTLKVDPSVVLATRKYAADGDTATAQTAATALQQHAESRNHPPATTTQLGFVKKATTAEAKNGAPDKFPDAAAMKAALAAAGYQFAKYDPDRTYETGETCRGSDGHFYEFYDRDGDGTVQDVDPTDSANRPHIWMRWDGVRPGTTIAWRSETLPEGYLANDGWQDAPRQDYRRIFEAFGTTWGEGDGSTTFGMPGDEDEFLRGWNPSGSRGLAEHQKATVVSMGDTSNDSPAVWSFHNGTDNTPQTVRTALNGESSDFDDAALNIVTANASVSGAPSAGASMSVRPRNNAVIWITKI